LSSLKIHFLNFEAMMNASYSKAFVEPAFVGIESWSKERIDWLRRFLTLENGIPSHDTLGRLFGFLDRRAVEKSFRAWVGSVLPALSEGQVVAIDGKASRRSRKKGLPPLHLVNAFATEARLILGQEACAEKSNELTAIPVLLESLMLKGVIVTIDAMDCRTIHPRKRTIDPGERAIPPLGRRVLERGQRRDKL
jgi:hypothetical protein